MRFSLFFELSHTELLNLDDITNENNKEHNEKWPYNTTHTEF